MQQQIKDTQNDKQDDTRISRCGSCDTSVTLPSVNVNVIQSLQQNLRHMDSLYF